MMNHQFIVITSLPFVHTARRSYRLSNPVNTSDRLLGWFADLVTGKSSEPYCLEEGEVVTRFPQVNLRKDQLYAFTHTPCIWLRSASRAARVDSLRLDTTANLFFLFAFHFYFSLQLLAVDVSAQVTMKDAAKCDKLCEWQNSANQQNAERILHSQVTPESMSKSGRLFSNATFGARSTGASSGFCVCVCQRRSSVDALKFAPFRE